MLCGWEGNSRSGVTLAMRHRLSALSTYGPKGQCAGDEHPTYASLEHGPFTVPVCIQIMFANVGDALCLPIAECLFKLVAVIPAAGSGPTNSEWAAF